MPKTKAKTKPAPKPDLVGVRELAARFDASPQLAHKWTRAHRFPSPSYELAAGRIWNFDDIAAWAIEHRPDLTKKLDPKLVRRIKRETKAAAKQAA